MNRSNRRKHSRRSRVKSTKSIRRLAACLGLLACFIGAGLTGTWLFHNNRKLLTIGAIYILAGIAIFGVQRGIHAMERHVKRRYRRLEEQE